MLFYRRDESSRQQTILKKKNLFDPIPLFSRFYIKKVIYKMKKKKKHKKHTKWYGRPPICISFESGNERKLTMFRPILILFMSYY